MNKTIQDTFEEMEAIARAKRTEMLLAKTIRVWWELDGLAWNTKRNDLFKAADIALGAAVLLWEESKGNRVCGKDMIEWAKTQGEKFI